MSSQRYLWLLDNGHAPSTPGKRSPELSDGMRLLEWEFARDVVDRIAAQLEILGVAYHRIAPRTNFDMVPTDRANLANEVADVAGLPSRAISVHANAANDSDDVQDGWTDAGGVTVLYYPTSSAGKILAQELQTKLVAASGLRDRGIKGRDDLSILKRTMMPAILSECGFYTNRREVKILLSKEGRDMFATAHVQFILSVEVG